MFPVHLLTPHSSRLSSRLPKSGWLSSTTSQDGWTRRTERFSMSRIRLYLTGGPSHLLSVLCATWCCSWLTWLFTARPSFHPNLSDRTSHSGASPTLRFGTSLSRPADPRPSSRTHFTFADIPSHLLPGQNAHNPHHGRPLRRALRVRHRRAQARLLLVSGNKPRIGVHT